MKSILIAATLAVVFATQAAALSCLRPDVADTFNRAAAAEESYVVLLGSFDFVMPQQPSTDINAPQTLRAQARFDGQFLSSAAFVPAPPLTVGIEFTCAGPWCGSLPTDGSEVLAFVVQSDDGYALNVGPCGGTAFVAPVAADIARVEACMRGEACEPDATR